MILVYGRKDTRYKDEGRIFLVASKEAGLEIKNKTKYMCVSCKQDLGQNNSIKAADYKCDRFQIFGLDINKECIHEGIKSNLHSGILTAVRLLICYLNT
jgi:hypothetical protein